MKIRVENFEAKVLKPTFFARPLSWQSRALNSERSRGIKRVGVVLSEKINY